MGVRDIDSQDKSANHRKSRPGTRVSLGEDRMLDEDEIADFAMGYLKNVAGWRLEKEG